MPGPQASEPTGGSVTPPNRFRRRVGTGAILVVVAVAPWFVPWHGLEQATPSTVRSSSQQPVPARTESKGPDEQSVEDLARTVSGARGYDLPVSPKEVAAVSTAPGPYQKLGRIQIPKVGLDASFGEGVFDKTLEKGPGHWPGTPMPGREGNSVISGHRNTHTQPFKELDQLRPGDAIIVAVGRENPVTFRVTGTKIIPEAEYKDFVLRQPDQNGLRQITLFACHPEGNPIFRIVVQANASP